MWVESVSCAGKPRAGRDSMWGKQTALGLLCALGVLLLLSGCGGSGASQTGNNNPPPTPAATTVTVTPATANVRAGDSIAFTATVANNTNTAVTWMVNSVANGNSTVGTIDATGNYKDPANLPNPTSITITATSAAVTTAAATAAVTLQNPIPTLSAVTPAFIPAGAFSLTVNGTKFVSGAKVMFGGQALTTNFVSASQLTATGTATTAQAGTVNVAVVNPDPGTVSSANYAVSVSNGAPKV